MLKNNCKNFNLGVNSYLILFIEKDTLSPK